MGLQAPRAPRASPGALGSSLSCSNKGEGIRQPRPRHADQERLRGKAEGLGHSRSKDWERESLTLHRRQEKAKNVSQALFLYTFPHRRLFIFIQS